MIKLHKLNQTKRMATKAVLLLSFYMAGAISMLCLILFHDFTPPKPTSIFPTLTITPTITHTPTVTPTPKNKVQVDRIVDIVYRLESSQGKNDPCRIKGGYNGFGMAPGTCYSSHEEVRAKVVTWFNKCLNVNGYSLSHCACSYNLGPRSPHKSACEDQSPDYPYYLNLLSYLK